MRISKTLVFMICGFLFVATCAWSAQWLWQADNHTENTSYFTDGVTTFTTRVDDGWSWDWNDPGAGAVSLRSMNLEKATRGRAYSSDFGDALNIDKGVTIAARVKPVNAHSTGTICLSIANSSTADLPGGSTHLWIGWDVPDMVVMCNCHGIKIKSFESSVKYEDTWCIWTLSAKQIGNTVAWNVWINGVQQAADQKAADDTFHTLVWTRKIDFDSKWGTSVIIGEEGNIAYPHDTAWDYVAITNEGVIPGWNGNATPAVDVTPAIRSGNTKYSAMAALHRARVLMFMGRGDEAAADCEKALGSYKGEDAGIAASLQLTQANALMIEGKLNEALDATASVAAANITPEWTVLARQVTGDCYQHAGKTSEAIEAYQVALAANGGFFPKLEALCRFTLASCYRRIGEFDNANSQLHQIKDLKLDEKWSLAADKELEILAKIRNQSNEGGGQ